MFNSNKELSGYLIQQILKVQSDVNTIQMLKDLIGRYLKQVVAYDMQGDAANELIASHIKPWSQSDELERLDIENVLLLCPHHDTVFDKGYITFAEDGTLIISSELSSESRALLNLVEGKKVSMSSKNEHYLRWHRENLFRQ